ncbi:MAG: cupin domain-containing protein [Herpetosiphonaceae bacterium]|nr:cupin domain-containing protein [Herpetosiphonaceae bacterium]
MNICDVSSLLVEQQAPEHPYVEVVRVPALSVGVYRLPVGATDHQQPHTEDEVYYVIQGRGWIRVAAEDREVATGAVVYVAAGVPHYFHTITEELAILVVFAPAEYTLAPQPRTTPDS